MHNFNTYSDLISPYFILLKFLYAWRTYISLKDGGIAAANGSSGARKEHIASEASSSRVNTCCSS